MARPKPVVKIDVVSEPDLLNDRALTGWVRLAMLLMEAPATPAPSAAPYPVRIAHEESTPVPVV